MAENPANRLSSKVTDATRVPMSVPTRRLEVPEGACPGYHLYWFLDENIIRAQRAGYEFVDANEVSLNQKNVATDASVSGNLDMGSRVCVYAGIGRLGKPEYLYLMKLREDWWKKDQKALEQMNQRVLDRIFREKAVVDDGSTTPSDRSSTYVKTSLMERK
jgi:hypothetical protein